LDKSNIILCLTDQWRAFEAGCYGNKQIQTPHLDALAREGVQFEYGISNDPVCTPARSVVLSGQHYRTCSPIRTNTTEQWPAAERGQWFPERTVAECFRDSGYHTTLIGKWHVGPRPSLCGFNTAVYPNMIHRHYGQEYVIDEEDPFVVEEFAPDFEKRQLEQFLGREHEKPFFLYYNISQPHMPIGKGNLPGRFRGIYSAEEMPLRPNVFDQDGKMAHDEEWFWIYLHHDYWYRKMVIKEKPRKDDRLPPGYDLKDLYRDYYEMVTCADDQLGSLIRLLKENHLENDTILVFASDHGDNLGSHHYFNKGKFIEESIRVPFIFYAPRRLKAHHNTTHLAQLVDIMPTLLDFAEIPIPQKVQGRSMRPVLEQSVSALEDNFAFIETPAGDVGLRSRSHLLGMHLELNTGRLMESEMEFYDMEQDPFQMHNLAADGLHGGEAQVMKDRLALLHNEIQVL